MSGKTAYGDAASGTNRAVRRATPRLYICISTTAGIVVALVGGAVLLGWWLHIPALKTVVPGLTSMKPNTAVCLAMAGLALSMSRAHASRGLRRSGAFFALATLVVATLTVTEYAARHDFGIDQLLFAADPGDSPLSIPGRMAPVTAICLALSGLAIFLLNLRPVLAQLAALPVLTTAVVSVAGYIFGVQSFYTVVGFASVALHTAIALLVLSSGILAARTTAGFMDVVAGTTLGGVMFRRLLLIPFVLFAATWLVWQGLLAGLYDLRFQVALTAVIGTATSLAATGIVARALNSVDHQRHRLIGELQSQLRNRALAASIIESSEDAVVSKTLDGTILSWNPGAEKVFGYRASEVVGTSIARLFPNDRLQEEDYLLGEMRAGRAVSHFQTKRVRKDGTFVDVSVTLSPIRDENGAIFAVSKVARDITEQLRQQEAALAAAIVEHSEDAIISDTEDGTVLSWNRGAERLFGYTKAEMLGHSITRLFPKDRANEQRYFLDQLAAGKQIAQFETSRLRKDGATVHVLMTVSAIRDASGKIAALSKVAHDITERKRSEAARAHLAAIVAHSDDGIVSVSLNGTVLSWNSGAERLFGYSAAEMVGRAVATLFPAGEADDGTRWIAQVISEREACHFETKRIRKDGAAIDVSVTLSPLRDDRDRLIGLSAIVRDITERLRLQAQTSLTRDLQESENRLKQFIERAPGGIAMFDTEMRCLAASRRWCQDYSVSRTEIIGRSHYEVFPEITQAWKEIHRRALAGETLHADEDPFVRTDGSTQWIKWEVGPWLTISGEIGGIVIVAEEITARKRAEQQLAAQHALMRVTLESIGDAVITTDRSGSVEWLNPVASRMTGWLVSEARGKPVDQVFRIVHEETRHPALNPAARALSERRILGLPEQTVLIARDGTEHGIQDSAAPIRDEKGDVLGIVLVFHDVTEQRRLAREMSHRATHDALTGLVNRSEFEVRLRRAFASMREEGHTHAVMYVDLDQFKLVNDACGHASGDRCLREVAALFQGVIRARDTLARLGGDEFGLLLEHCTVQQARRVAEELCERMEEFRFIHDERRFRVGASIGVVPLDGRWPNEAQVMQAADAACYAAKEAGRNRVHEWFDTDVVLKARHGDMQWVTRLGSALDEHRFRLYAQRIEGCKGDSSRLFFEVLLRLIDTDGSVIAPSTFLPAAERFNMAARIDRWVVREALDWLVSQDIDRIDTVAVNLSGHSIGDRSFHRYVVEQVSRIGKPGRLCFEITETAAITHLEDAKEFITAMRQLGVRIALDDFGSGISSFGYLKTLPVDFLKISGQFVQDLLEDRLDHTAVCCFRDIAATCGLQTVAECVETEEVLAELRRIGIDFAQGFLIHRPEPLEKLASGITGVRCDGSGAGASSSAEVT